MMGWLSHGLQQSPGDLKRDGQSVLEYTGFRWPWAAVLARVLCVFPVIHAIPGPNKTLSPTGNSVTFVSNGHTKEGAPLGVTHAPSEEMGEDKSTQNIGRQDTMSTDDEAYTCEICGWEYHAKQGDPENDVTPGTPWKDIPEGWCCPDCGAEKDAFSPS